MLRGNRHEAFLDRPALNAAASADFLSRQANEQFPALEVEGAGSLARLLLVHTDPSMALAFGRPSKDLFLRLLCNALKPAAVSSFPLERYPR